MVAKKKVTKKKTVKKTAAKNTVQSPNILNALAGIGDGLNKLSEKLDAQDERLTALESNHPGIIPVIPRRGDRMEGEGDPEIKVHHNTDAKNHQVTKTGIYDTDDHENEQYEDREMRSDGPASEALDGPSRIQVERTFNPEKMEALAFAEQKILIKVHETRSETEDPLPHVSNDGVNQYFFRGEKQWVKRKYVEILCRMQRTNYGNEKYINNQGDEAYRYPPHTNMEIPFQVLQDPAGERGARWLADLQRGA